jgi:hypothetical protein
MAYLNSWLSESRHDPVGRDCPSAKLLFSRRGVFGFGEGLGLGLGDGEGVAGGFVPFGRT